LFREKKNRSEKINKENAFGRDAFLLRHGAAGESTKWLEHRGQTDHDSTGVLNAAVCCPFY